MIDYKTIINYDNIVWASMILAGTLNYISLYKAFKEMGKQNNDLSQRERESKLPEITQVK